MRCRDLPALVLQHVGVRSLQHTGSAATKSRRMLSEFFSAPAGLYADELYLLVFQEVVKDADGVRPAAHACDDRTWQFIFRIKDLGSSFAADDPVEVSHHGRVGMRT